LTGKTIEFLDLQFHPYALEKIMTTRTLPPTIRTIPPLTPLEQARGERLMANAEIHHEQYRVRQMLIDLQNEIDDNRRWLDEHPL